MQAHHYKITGFLLFVFVLSMAGEADAQRRRKRKQLKRQPPPAAQVVPQEEQQSPAGATPIEPEPQTELAPEVSATPPAAPTLPEEELSLEVIDAAASTEGLAESSSAISSVHEHDATDEDKEVFSVTVGVELGVGFSQLLSKLGTTPVPSLHVGYLLPVFQQRLEIFVDGAYVQPLHERNIEDSRLGESGEVGYRIIEREVLVGFGILARLFPPGSGFNVYGQLGPQLRLQRSDVSGEATGAALGNNQETMTAFGMLAAAGVEYGLGPGAVAAELEFSFSQLNHRITGDALAGGLLVKLGYHFLF